MVDLYKIKPFTTNDTPQSNKYPFKTITKLEPCVKCLKAAHSNIRISSHGTSF